ncbi:hypothetical protein ACRARG_12595 [Pseudooceanicola sp. C21-150M6]|uniref:hypothetical protein n=1 Tax=Pseudooceanicola sp. C21-150M6 TaxID=3434355 RepID=UPI003D7FDF5B
MAKFDVKRDHLGDRPYKVGDTRDATKAEVAHLVAKGVLSPVKAAPKPKNKAAPATTDKKA